MRGALDSYSHYSSRGIKMKPYYTVRKNVGIKTGFIVRIRSEVRAEGGYNANYN